MKEKWDVKGIETSNKFNQEAVAIVLKLIYDGKYPYPYGTSRKSDNTLLFCSLFLEGIFDPIGNIFSYLAKDGKLISIDLSFRGSVDEV